MYWNSIYNGLALRGLFFFFKMEYTNEGAIRAYEVGYNDGQNGTDNFNNWFDDEVVETVNNYEYKFIK